MKFLKLSLSAIPVLFAACSDVNPIEAENSTNESAIVKDLASNTQKKLDQVDYIACKAQYSETRCDNFYKKFGTYDTPEIRDPYYNDKGEFDPMNPLPDSLFKAEDDSTVTPLPEPDPVNYLTENKTFRIITTSFVNNVEDASFDLRYELKYFSDSVLVTTQRTPFLLEDSNQEWTGDISVTKDITKGIDQIQLCPQVYEKGKNEDILTSTTEECINIYDIGLLKNRELISFEDSTESYSISWKNYLY